MKIKKISLLLLLAVAVNFVYAAPPTSYYSTADGKGGEALRQALHSIIGPHTNIGYAGIWTIYKATDLRPDGTVWDMYSTCTWQYQNDQCGQYNQVCGCYNREHSVPKSWFSDANPMYADAMHLYPTDGYVNSQRSNYPFGECANGVSKGEKALGRLGNSTFPGYSIGTVFEPADEYKGDFARTYFYFATCYADKCANWGHNIFSVKNSGLSDYAVALFMKWHRQDPVSEKERKRNDAIYNNNTGKVQGNRNPFIDYPCLAEFIWGSRKTENVSFVNLLSAYDAGFDESDLTGCSATADPTLQTPTNGQLVSILGANLNGSTDVVIPLKGVNFVSDVTLAISGSDASLFKLSKNVVTATEINVGVDVVVTYSPTSLGNHTTSLKINSTDLPSTVTVVIKASCNPALIEPTADEIHFSQDNVGEAETQQIMFKAVNVTKDVTLSLSGDNAASFSLSAARTTEYTMTAAEAMAGKLFALTYTPTSIGTAHAQIVVSSEEFSARTIDVVGTTAFSMLPATDITTNSFTANWTYAGDVEYTLSVFTKQSTGSEETVLFDADVTSEEDAENGGLFKVAGNSFAEANNGGLRLGTSSGDATITSVGVDFSMGGTLVVTAQDYHTDGAELAVFVGSEEVGRNALTSSFKQYTFAIPATAEQVIIKQGISKKRLVISHIKLIVGVEGEEVDVMVEGFPIKLNNMSSYVVSNLEDNTDYFYTVSLADGTTDDPWQVRTGFGNITDQVPTVADRQFIYYQHDGQFHIENLTPGSTIRIFTTSGVMIDTRTDCQSYEVFTLPKGVYIMSLSTGEAIKIAM